MRQALVLVLLLFCSPALLLRAQGAQQQTIAFVPVSDVPVNTAPFQIVALSDAYLPVTLNVKGPATLNGRLLTLTGIGTVTVTATQAGDSVYSPTSAQLSFQSIPVTPVVQWAPASIPYGTPLPASILNATALASPVIDSSADTATMASQLGASFLGFATPQYGPASSVFRYENATLSPTTDPNGAGGWNVNVLPAPYALDYRVAFTCDCDRFEVVLEARQGSYRLWVDGSYTSLDSTSEPQNYPEKLYVLVSFPDRRPRQIKFTVSGNAPFFGVDTPEGETISAPQVPIGPRVMIFGDSWTGPTILAPLTGPPQDGLTGSGYPQTLGEYFNWDYWDDGVGGSGFTVPGTDALDRTFVQRTVTDTCPNAFDAVLILGGVNDGGATEPAMQAAVATTLSELQSCLPKTPVYLYGPQFENAPLDQAMAAAIAGATNVSLSYTDMGEADWFYGSDTDASTGNEYLYFAAHPTPLGHDYLAEQIARDLMMKYPAMAPQPYALFTPVPVAGSVTYSAPAGVLLPAGNNAVTATFTPDDSTTYLDADLTATVVVTKATTSLMFNGSAGNNAVTAVVSPQIGGVPTGTITFLANGKAFASSPLQAGTASANMTSAEGLVGTEQITAQYSGDSNFLPSASAAALAVTVIPADFTFNLSSQQITIAAGSPTSVTAAITPTDGLAGPLTLACAGLPQNVNCSLSPGTASLAGTAGSVTVNFQAAGAGRALLQRRYLPGKSPIGQDGRDLGCMLGAIVLWRKRKAVRAYLPLVTLLACVCLLGGCGAAVNTLSVTPGSYTVQVQLTVNAGTPAAVTHTQTLTLVVS